jgi:hypothetical protein
MRLIDIALFIFIMNISVGIANQIFLYPEFSAFNYHKDVVNNSQFNFTTTNQQYLEKINSTSTDIGAQGGIVTEVFNYFGLGWLGFVKLISPITELIGGLAFGVHDMIMRFVGDTSIEWLAWSIQGIVYLIYALGLMQYMSGRGFREYQ